MINVVWLKRDFRLSDHAPITKASQSNLPTVYLYVIESQYWQLPDTSLRQFNFISESLLSLATELEKKGAFLTVRKGDILDVLNKIHEYTAISTLMSHQETGNTWTYSRDKAVFSWCKRKNIAIETFPQQAVFRGPLNRDNWQKLAEEFLHSSPLSVSSKLPSLLNRHSGLEHLRHYPGNDSHAAHAPQLGGLQAAHDVKESFFNSRINQYLYGISSPIASQKASSRLSPYLCYGVLSLREVLQEAYDLDVNKRHRNAFVSRLHWHSHFVQKLETEPEYCEQPIHRSLTGMRADEFDEALFQRWCKGETGVPFIDACMRMLSATGWINFRMRAMLMAFSSYHLWLDWKKPAQFLAQQFVDYEPGIHYPQIQMQSGTTGINPFRIYNPVLQGQKYDPDGTFIRHWLPELDHVPTGFIHTPWLYNKLNTDVYEHPKLLPEIAARVAKEKISQFYKLHVKSTETRRVVKVHASRKRKSKRKLNQPKDNNQMSLF